MKTNCPKKIKILFIGLAQSTHTHSWVELLKNQELDIRVFGINDTVAPSHFKFPTYSFNRSFPSLQPHPTLNLQFKCERKLANLIVRWLRKDKFWSEETWLVRIINKWQPDIIHTLGLDPASFVYCTVRKRCKLKKHAIWVATARGGPELALKRLIPKEATKIKHVLEACDQFIADNEQNYNYALQLGLNPSKVSMLGVIPGTGGVAVDELSAIGRVLPSKRDRIIVWPKAYECPASKALPVFEAFRLCWESIRPCEIHMTAMIPETRMWFKDLPREIRDSCHLDDRIPKKDLLALMARSRVMLAPSLSEGIPNCLYEAMAAGAFPILSPLDTVQRVVSHERNVLFARNLYPQEIADALIRAMNDDTLVDCAAKKNLELVKKIADRSLLASKVINYYKNTTGSSKTQLKQVNDCQK